MSTTSIIGEGSTLFEALQSAAGQLGVTDLGALRWTYEREHFRGGAWSVRVVAQPLPEEELAALRADAETTEVGRRWLSEVLDWFDDPDAQVVTRRNGDELVLSIEGARDSRLLIGRDGKNLPAFQHLLDKAMARELGAEARVTLDIEGYLGDREGRLEEHARQAVDEVLRTGDPIRLAEMNSYERRLVHTLVKEIEGVVSSSVGRADSSLKAVEIRLADAARG